MKYQLKFYHPAFMDVSVPDIFEFETKEELLANEEIRRVSSLDFHIRWEQITDDGKSHIGLNIDRSVLMHICKGEKGEMFFVKAFIVPHLQEQLFPEWIYENYKKALESLEQKEGK